MDIALPDFEVFERIGVGCMGEVYRARQIQLDREVALKILLPQFANDPGFCERFFREVRAAAKLYHPNIVQILSVDKQQGQLYLCTEYVDGGDLSHRLQSTHSQKPLSIDEIVTILTALTNALDFAHSLGYVHGDIKPANILFRKSGSLVISDFGLAKAIYSDAAPSISGSMVGTPLYTSPEQAQALTLDGHSDLYSVGVIAFQMLTGELPYKGNSALNIAIKHISHPVPQLGNAFQPLQRFFDQALAKNPAERFDTGAQMMECLKSCLLALDRSEFSTAAKSAPTVEKNSSPTTDSTRVFSPYAKKPEARSNHAIPETGLHADNDRFDMSSHRVARAPTIQRQFGIGPVPVVVAALLATAIGAYTFGKNDSNPPTAVQTAGTPTQSAPPTPPTGSILAAQQSTGATINSATTQTPVVTQANAATTNTQANNAAAANDAAAPASPQPGTETAQTASAATPGAADDVNSYLAKAKQKMTQGVLLGVPKNNAYYYYRQALKMEPGNKTALRGIAEIKSRMVSKIRYNIKARNVAAALNNVETLEQLDSQHSELPALRNAITELESQLAREQKYSEKIAKFYSRANRYLADNRADGADKMYAKIFEISASEPRLPGLGKRIADGYVFLAQKEINARDWKDAEEWAQRGLHHNPNQRDLLRLRVYAADQLAQKAAR